MCGIAGIYQSGRQLSPADIDVVIKMTDVLTHRGPDEEGIYHDTHFAVGHRRLSIQDLENGKQPMNSLCGRFVLSFNGEIYNFIELREELGLLGHVFQERSDTEVLLHALMEWETDALQRLNGDFAFAFWDRDEQTLLLVRDRVGVKPLYVVRTDGGVAFASEIKALIPVFPDGVKIDPYGYFEMLAYCQPIAPKTMYEGISLLEPGSYLKYSNGVEYKGNYWDITYTPRHVTPKEAQAEIFALLKDATKIRLRSDVPISAMLSGGVDSSALCSLIRDEIQTSFKTFSVDYHIDDDTSDNLSTHMHGSDMYFSRFVADKLQTDHHPIMLKADVYCDSLELSAGARDLPVCLGSEIGMYHLLEHISAHSKVALSGDGADEVFLGYYMIIEDSLKKGSVDAFFANSSEQIFMLLSPAVIEKYKPVEYIRQRFSEIVGAAPVGENDRVTLLNQIHYLQIKLILPYLLDRADRLSSAHSVELRVPYCDHRIIEYFFSLPVEQRYVEGQEKYTLRETFRNALPKEVYERKKSVFPYPGKPEQLKKLYDHSLKVINDNTLPLAKSELLNPQVVAYLLHMAMSGSLDHWRAHAISSHIVTLNHLFQTHQLGSI